MELLLCARRPEKFRRNVKQEIVGKDGEPIIPPGTTMIVKRLTEDGTYADV